MPKNPLEELLKKGGRSNPSYDPSQQALNPSVSRGGDYFVPVQQTPKTNAALDFAKALSRTPEVYKQAVDMNQERAARDIAEMSDEEFNTHYNDLLSQDKEVQSLFGYNKAYQEKLVERTYKDVVPLELKDLEKEFKGTLQNYDSIDDYDNAVNNKVNEYFDSLNTRFNGNEFASNAHNTLAVGQKAKLIVNLHDAYIEETTKYIREEEIDTGSRTLEKLDGEYDSLGTTLTELNIATTNNLGDKKTANETTRSTVASHLDGLISLSTTEGLENAEDLFNEVFTNDEPLLVNGKDIFEGSEGQKMETEYRVKLHNARLALPQLLDAKYDKIENEYTARIIRAQGNQEELDAIFSELDAKIQQEGDDGLTVRLNKYKDTIKRDPSIFIDVAVNDFVKGVPKNTAHKFNDNVTFTLINSEDINFTQREKELFFKRQDGGTGDLVGTELAMELSGYHQKIYNQLKREKLQEIYLNPNLSDVEREQQAQEALQEAYEESNEAVKREMTRLTQVNEPKIEAQTAEQLAINAGANDMELNRVRNITDPVLQIQEFHGLAEESVDRDDPYTITDGKVQIKINKNESVATTLDNYAQVLKLGFNDRESALEAHYAVMNQLERKGVKYLDAVGQQYANGGENQALDALWQYKELVGFTKEELDNGYVSVDYIVDNSSVYSPYGIVTPSERVQTIEIPLEKIWARDTTGKDPRMASEEDYAIVIDGDIANTIYALKEGNVSAFLPSGSIETLEARTKEAQRIYDAQRRYFEAMGYLEAGEVFDDDDFDPDDTDPEKKTLENNEEVEAIDSDILARTQGKYRLNDEPTNVHEEVLDKYNLRTERAKIFVDYKDFAKKFYTSRLPNANPEAIDRIVDAKFQLMEERSPELIGTKNTEVQMIVKDLGDSTGGLARWSGKTIEISNRYRSTEALEQTIMHELVHAAQMKGTRGKMTNLMTNERVRKASYTTPERSYIDYLNSPLETDARLAEVARKWVLDGNEFIDPRKGTEVAEEALLDFLTDYGTDEFETTRNQLFRMLELPRHFKEPTVIYDNLTDKEKERYRFHNVDEDGRVPWIKPEKGDRERLREELRKNPNIELILESIGTLVQNDSTNNNEQLA